MQALTSWPMGRVALGLSLGLAALGALTLLIAWRSKILFKLGTRNVPRRRARAALIVFGLTLSTTVIGSAMSTGDSMTHTVRSLVSESLGPIDEVVVFGPARTDNGNQISNLTQPGLGQLANANLNFFDSAQASGIADNVKDSAAIDSTLPVIVEQATAVRPDTHQAQALLTLLAMPTDYPSSFGQMDSSSGQPIDLAKLKPDEIVMNDSAAASFGATPGQALQILVEGRTWNVHLGAIVQNQGLGGLGPTIIAPLASVQQATEHVGQVNMILVSNRGGVDSVTRTSAASQAIRLPLANREAAQGVYAFLHRPEIQQALLTAAGNEFGIDRSRILAIRSEAARPQMSDQFVSEVSDPQTRHELFRLGFSLPVSASDRPIFEQLRDVTDFAVLNVKQDALDRANEYGTVVTTVFLVLGLASVAAGVLLVFLIFSLLAADRGPELATMRALGMSRGQIVSMFLFEGLVYDILAASLGGLLGFAVSYVSARSLASSLATFGFHLSWYVEPRTVLITFAGGVLLTFLAMLGSAWRASRSGIVAATRGDDIDENRAWVLIPGTLLLVAGWLIWWRWHVPRLIYEPRNPLVFPGTVTVALLGLACLLTGAQALLSRKLSPRRAGLAESVVGWATTLIGVALFVLWLRAMAHLPTPRGSTLADATTVAIGGVMLVLSATWASMRLLRPALRLLDWSLSSMARLRSVVRPAVGYLGDRPWRTGFAVIMFGIIIFTMVTSLTMINALLNAYSPSMPPIAGFDIRVDQSGPTLIPDMNKALSGASAVSDKSFSRIGSITTVSDAEVVQLGVARTEWEAAPLQVVDNGFLTQSKVAVKSRLPQLQGPAIWWALRDQPGTAVVSATLLNSVIAPPANDVNNKPAPFTLWVRPSDGGQPVKLNVIGIIDSRSDLDPGIYTSQTTASGMGVSLGDPSSFLFALKPGVKAADATEGLRLSFGSSGLNVTNLSDKAQVGRSIRLLLTRIVQGFMGLGLIAGIAALGMLGVQSVIERRVQLGTLRALGFTRWQTRATLAFEAAITAALGIGMGIGLGLIMAHTLVRIIALQHPEVHYSVPWSQVILTAAVAVIGSILSVTVAVWQAGRVSPADALRG